MRFFDEKRKTTNRTIYKQSAIIPNLGCSLCGINRGCNRMRSYSYGRYNSWKTNKKQKQWM